MKSSRSLFIFILKHLNSILTQPVMVVALREVSKLIPY